MTKRIFRSIFTVAAVILLASFVLITGVLYEYFSNKQMDQLNMQTHLAAQGIESAGEEYFSDMDISGCRTTAVPISRAWKTTPTARRYIRLSKPVTARA